MFGYVLDKNKPFLDYKAISLKQSPNWIFFKGLAYDFGEKFKFCYCFFMVEKGLGTVFAYVLYRKQTFLDSKNIDFR